MRTLHSAILTIFCSAAFAVPTFAQDFPTFEELHRQMREMQQQMMEQLRNTPFQHFDLAQPRWDTTYQFRFDTTFEGGSLSHRFFHFSPFGNDSTLQNDFLGFGRFFDQFFNFGKLPEKPDYGIHDFPTDDGAVFPADDDLLPEERLRQQEEKDKSRKKQGVPKNEETKPDQKVKTIRI
ncbi:MAG: hypothetical protein KIS77_18105 [Saprospiraceae bacterium]|nr:hypothetical protein [Saprospiraceae bacterium]